MNVYLLPASIILRQCQILDQNPVISCFQGSKTGQARERCFNESGINLNLKFDENLLELFISIDPKVLCKDKKSFTEAFWCSVIQDRNCLSDEYQPYYTTSFDKIQDAVNFQCSYSDDLDYQCMRNITQDLYQATLNTCPRLTNARLYKTGDGRELCLYSETFVGFYQRYTRDCSCPELYHVLLANCFYPEICNKTYYPVYVEPGACYVPPNTTVSPTTTTVSNAPLSNECQAFVVATVLMLTTLAQIL